LNTILSVGLHRVWPSVLSPSIGLLEHGIRTVFLYRRQKNEFIHTDARVGMVATARNGLLELFQFLLLLLRERPGHLEVYFHHGRWNTLRCQMALADLLGIPIVAVCIGKEVLDFEELTSSHQAAIRAGFQRARRIVAFELYMEDKIVRLGLAGRDKIVFCSNKIIIGPEPVYSRPSPRILYLNLFKSWRHVDLIIQAIPEVIRAIPGAHFVFVGTGRYPEREESIVLLAQQLGVADKCEFHPYTQGHEHFYDEAAVFVLPADIVFCNMSLLEAMERGVPAVVADVPGAERIIENGVEGFRVAREPAAIAEGLIGVLKNEERREQFARAARAKIIRDFDEQIRARLLINLYNTRVWKRPQAGRI